MADNAELWEIYDADQHDRSSGAFDTEPEAVMSRDHARHERVAQLLDAGAVVSGADHFHAAMVLQHGGSLDSFRQAHELAAIARRLGDSRGTWLAAAALDRWLTSQGRLQHYGTQYQPVAGRWQLLAVDPRTPDAERAAWNVPSMHDALARADRMNTEHPPPPGQGWPILRVDQEQVERGEPVPFRFDDSDAVVMVPLAGLGLLNTAIVVVLLPGASANGTDLQVQIVVVTGSADDFHAWASPWADSEFETTPDRSA